jgi:hypothetical protein
MSAFIDVRCPECDRKFGWFGEFIDRPPCPKCGHRLPKSELEEIQAKMDEQERLMELRLADGTIEDRRLKRVQSGLTLRQAAKLAGIVASRLSNYENGREDLTPEELAKLDALYSGDLE